MTSPVIESLARLATRQPRAAADGDATVPRWSDSEPPDDAGRPSVAEQLRGQLLARADLTNLPEPEPLIENTLDRRTIALLAGHTGTGKSFIALDWACCVATGHAWQGRP